MYLGLKKYLLVLMMVFLVGCSVSDDIKDAVSDDKSDVEVVFSGESLVTNTQAYKTGYFTSFIHQNGNNLFEESDGALHLAFVDNYELFYSKSLDEGKTWSKEKIETGHDGALRRASLTVDGNGKVFIGFETHDKFNYADVTSVAYSSNFEYDVYCATNKSGTWSIELLYTHENGTTGREITGMDVDSENNIYIFAGYYGWWSYGGTAYEYIRSATTDTWGSATQIAKFTDTTVDRGIYGYYASHIESDGDITVVALRQGTTTGTTDKLFYIRKQSGIWATPVEVDTPVRANHRTNHFDSAMDSNNNIYLAYVKDDSLGNPQVLFSTDFGETTPIYTGTVGEVIHSIKLHSDASGDLTLLVNNDTEKSVILTKSTTGSWSSAVDLDTDITDGMIYNVALVQTNTASGYFSDFKMTYLESRGVLPTNGEYNSSKIYFYALSAEVDGSNASQDISTVEQLVIDHYNGVDFSAKGTGVDGYTTTWSPTGYYVDGEEYGSGLWYSNGLYDITQTYVYIQSFGDVSLDSITSVNTTAWHPYGDALESLQLNHVYVVKTEDGYVKFKVLSLDSQSDNWNFTASYQFSSNTIF